MPVSTIARNHTWELAPLCEGGFGQIYVTRHPKEGTLLIMKISEIPRGKDHIYLPRMEYEALRRVQTCKNANHYVVEQPDLGRENMWWSAEHARVFLLFNYYPRTLDQLMNEQRHLIRQPAYLQTVIYDVVCGLDYLHRLKIIHKDIKPENIFVDRYGTYKIGDLGGALVYGPYNPSTPPLPSAKVRDLETNDPGVRTYQYCAPEVVIPAHKTNGRNWWVYNDSVDFWSLGMVAYEIVVGYDLPWCAYASGNDLDDIHISPGQIPHIMKHVLASHHCDPTIRDFILKACHPTSACRLRRESALAIVEQWPPYEEPFANRFSNLNHGSPIPGAEDFSQFPNFILGKREHPKQALENIAKSEMFRHMLETSDTDIPERPGYRYRYRPHSTTDSDLSFC